MAVESPGFVFIQSGGETAERARRALAALSGLRGGVVAAGDLAVVENGTPNMSVNVAGGQVIIPGTEGSFQGSYVIENRGTLNVAIAAADATNPRKDLIVAKVQDAAYSGVSNVASIVVVTGTPAGSPVEPAVPNNAWVLAMIDVPALDTAITNSQITDRRTSATNSQQGRAAALGGTIMLPAGSGAFPAQQEGRLVYEQSTKRLHVGDGTAYQRIGWAAASGRTGCRVRRAAVQSIPNATSTSLSFDTEDDDTDGFFAPTSTTITIPTGLGGLYAITFFASGPGISGESFMSIFPTSALTGMPAQFVAQIPSSVAELAALGIVIPLLAGDSFVCRVNHTTGAANNFTGWASCYRMGL
jgi:hypothetical protein